ncbi:TPA: hypothetical protein DEP96_00185 [Candidatus Uhrbacteria bacterium]|nr:hypothetical protein [Candidatus Uhrbacteria bacterium]
MLKRARIIEGLGQAAIIAVPLTVIVILGWLRLAPSGTFVVWTDTLERSPYIDQILPASRAPVRADGEGVQIIDDPVYFMARVPKGDYTSAEVTLDYHNHGQPVFKLGVITDMTTNSFDLRTFDNFIVDETDWQESTVNFDISQLSRTNGAIKFILSAPQVKNGQHSVDIKRIKIAWHKEPLSYRAVLGQIWHAVTPW